VISLYYYAGVIREMYFRASPEQSKLKISPSLKIAIIISILGVLICGIYPQPFIQLAQQAAAIFQYPTIR